MARLFYVLSLAAALAVATAIILALELNATLVGSLGVSLLLAAFLLNMGGWFRAGGLAYLTLNPVGAVLACLSSYMIKFMPFVLLEGTWAIVAGAGLVRAALPVGVNSESQVRRWGRGLRESRGRPK